MFTNIDANELAAAVAALGFGPPSTVGRLFGQRLMESGDDAATAAGQVVSDGLTLGLFPLTRHQYAILCARDAECGKTWFRGPDSAASRAMRDRRLLLGKLEQTLHALIRMKECLALLERSNPKAMQELKWSEEDAAMLERALGDFEPTTFTPDYPSRDELDQVDNSRP